MHARLVLETRHFIGGDFLRGSAGEQMDVVDPSTAEVIGTIARGTEDDVEAAVAAARGARKAWGRSTPAERAGFLLRLADSMEKDIDTLVALESLDLGKPKGNARQEARFAIDLLRFCAGAGRCLEGKASGEYLPAHTSLVRREPLGIVAGITPWNYPIVMLAYKLGPALATGNVIIVKPAEQTPLTTLRVARLAAEILPPGVFNVITGDEIAGSALVRHPEVRLVSLTGSTETGRLVARDASTALKRVTLELGGKAPVVVLRDADLEQVVASVRKAAFYNSGQDCTAATRIIAEHGIYDDLRSALLATIPAVRVGAPADGEDIEMGPLVSAAQLARVRGFVERAVKGAGQACLGVAPLQSAGYFHPPVLVTEVQQQDEIVQNEVFGPVVTLQPAANTQEAVALANGTPYGLGASLWTRDLSKAMTLSRDIEAGAVWVNCHDRVTPEMPHGGLKASGYGKDLSMYSLEDYCHIKHVMVHHAAD